eukprot:TRINITY_DN7410_c0_g1_i1.p1 TRINITY_DN7410_c0_g1~~TRINITY_DN7410_c0_g1_i1.p1  ORF type:complete len:280 (-),score=46.51 TRINITY_DN7410_c0_g1_i1:401-1240(-)
MSWFGFGSGDDEQQGNGDPFFKERAKLEAEGVETKARKWGSTDFEMFYKRCEETASDGWKQAYHDENRQLTVWTRPSTNAHDMLRARKVFTSISAELLYDMIHDHEFRESWDENMLGGKVLERLDSHNTVGYYSVKLPAGLSNRDFVNQRSWLAKRDADTPHYIICNHSVFREDCPPKDGLVRGWSYLSGYLIKEISTGGCELTYCTHADPRGWIPAFAINQVITVIGPRIMDKLEKVAPTYPQWLKENRPTNDRVWITPPTSPIRGDADEEQEDEDLI